MKRVFAAQLIVLDDVKPGRWVYGVTAVTALGVAQMTPTDGR